MTVHQTTILTEMIDGITFSYLNESEFRGLYNEIYKINEYIFSPRTTSPFILDCGANIGLSVLYFKKLYPHAKIIAFEANPETFKLLELNIRQNNLTDVQLVNAAVADSDGEMEFYVNDDAVSWSLSDTGIKNTYAGPNAWKSIKVPTVCLSSYITQHIDYLKLDIEGMEEIVLREIEGKLDLVEEIRMEFHAHIANPVNDLDRTLALLNKHGFKFAIERRQDFVSNELHLFWVYLHRQPLHLWWQSRVVPKVFRVLNRIKRLWKRVRRWMPMLII